MAEPSLPRTVVPAFAVSVAFHALAFWGVGVLPNAFLTKEPEPVSIELVAVASVPLPTRSESHPKPISYAPMKHPASAASKKTVPAQPQTQLAKPPAAPPAAIKTPETIVKRDRELLSDPSSAAGKLFNGYFRAVRRRIDMTVRREYEDAGVGKGDVSLVFVLNSAGRLEAVQAIASPDAPADVRAFAVRCLRESAPFPPFPRGLEASRISFNVTLLFEDL